MNVDRPTYREAVLLGVLLAIPCGIIGLVGLALLQYFNGHGPI